MTISFAARCTARTMRLCEAQRHRWPFSACLISALGRRGLRVEQRLGRHDHAVAAVAALAGLLLDEGLLQRVQLLDRAQALDAW